MSDRKETGDLGQEAVERIEKLWQVDNERVVRNNNGFDWWPSKYRVSVTAEKSQDEGDGDLWRLAICTEFLEDIDLDDQKTKGLFGILASFSPTYGWVSTPHEITAEHGYPRVKSVRFQSTGYLRHETNSWLPEFLGRMAILQPIDANRTAPDIAQLLRGRPNASGPNQRPPDDHLDDMLHVADALYGPAGKEESRWKDQAEFGEFAEHYGRSDLCYGNGDMGGLTLETPVGETSVLIRLRTDIPHPALGAGLLVSLELPFLKDEAAIIEDCIFLNFLESFDWSLVPQFGSWHPRKAREEQFRAAHSFFIPNILFRPGLATNAALWEFGRARWWKSTHYPDLVDLTMMEVLQRRFQLPESE